MTENLKPVGPYVLVRVEKSQSSIQLLPGTQTQDEYQAVIQALGTKSSLGLAVGDIVMFRPDAKPIMVQQDDRHELLLVPEVQVAYVKNYDRPGRADSE